jgi:HSP20 family protein
MSLIKWEPFGEIDRFFDEGFPSLARSRTGIDLAVDVYEDGSNVIAEMNVPGINPDDIDLHVEDNRLTISGSREEKSEKKEKNFYSKEIRTGSFRRDVVLPENVDASKTEAECSDGVLKIIMPKRAEEKPEKIKIKVGKS